MKIYTISVDDAHDAILKTLQKRWFEHNRSRTFARALEVADAGTAPLAITPDGKMLDMVQPVQPKRDQKRNKECSRSRSSTTKRTK